MRIESDFDRPNKGPRAVVMIALKAIRPPVSASTVRESGCVRVREGEYMISVVL